MGKCDDPIYSRSPSSASRDGAPQASAAHSAPIFCRTSLRDRLPSHRRRGGSPLRTAPRTDFFKESGGAGAYFARWNEAVEVSGIFQGTFLKEGSLTSKNFYKKARQILAEPVISQRRKYVAIAFCKQNAERMGVTHSRRFTKVFEGF